MKKFIILTLSLISISTTAFAQNVTVESYGRAQRVVERSLEAYGGLENLRAIQNFTVRLEGTDFHRNQGRRPGVPFPTPRIFEMTMDLKNNRYRLDFERSGVGSYVVKSIEISDAKERTYADLRLKTRTTGPARPNWREALSAQLMPHFVLLNGYGRLGQVRHLGRQTLAGKPHDVIAYPGAGGSMLSLYVDAESGLITKQESLVSDSFAGDALTETAFIAYQAVGKFKIPTEVVNSTAGVVTSRMRYGNVSFDRDLGDKEFLLDGELTAVGAQQPAAGPAVHKLGENVYTASVPGYKVLFIDFKDHIWALEAPVGDASARMIIQQIKETIPNKPIKYIALTHFHDDHASGARTFIAEGATLLTTKGNRGHFEQLMKGKFSIAPDLLTTNPQPLKLEFIENGKRVITDGTTTVELYEIGPQPACRGNARCVFAEREDPLSGGPGRQAGRRSLDRKPRRSSTLPAG